MRIGIPKEMKNGEQRVALTPQAVSVLIADGHQVWLEAAAGKGSGFIDQSYQLVGAEIVSQQQVWSAELVVKVKEPLPEEYQFLCADSTLFTYLHLAAAPELLEVLLERQVRAVAYETVALEHGALPLLAPMSQIAGRVSMFMAAQYLRSDFQYADMTGMVQKGMLLGGVPHVDGGMVSILGAGQVGQQAAQVALALGAKVILFDCNATALTFCQQELCGDLHTFLLTEEMLQQYLPQTDVLIGAALVVGERAPQLLSLKSIAMMPKGSVFMDVAIDQGGVSQSSHVTSYDAPVYGCNGVWHCCLPNFPACVPHSSSLALAAATLEYVRLWARLGLEQATEVNAALARGINTWDGAVVHAGVAHAMQVR